MIITSIKLKEIINAFEKWYINDIHAIVEDFYSDNITFEKISNLSQKEFEDFFLEFAKDGGKIQSGGARTADKFIQNVHNNFPEFKEKILAPFNSNFNVDNWIKWAESFKYFGKGLATIYLNRVDKTKYVVVNNKSIEAYRILGYDVANNPLERTYKDILAAQSDIIKKYPELSNFFKADALSHFLIGTPEGMLFLERGDHNTIHDMAKIKNERKYWLYAPGENAKMWEEFYNQSIMGLGWDKLGDLKKYKSKEEIVLALQEIENTSSSKKNDASANYDFLNTLSIDDIVIAKKGRSDYLGYGIVKSNYYYDSSRENYKKCRKVNWIKRGTWPEDNDPIVVKTLTEITKYPDYVEKLKKLIGIGDILSLNKNIWIEKTLVRGRRDRTEGERSLGLALWSPKTDKRGADIYKNMREVKSGDIILHLRDNEQFSGISIALEPVIETSGIKDTEWAGPAYLIKLEKYIELEQPINRLNVLNENNRTELERIANSSEVFYTNDLNLRQGAYLTPCPLNLLSLINKSYLNMTGLNLPYIEEYFANNHIELNFELDLKKIFIDLADSGLQVNNGLIIRFIASILTKPFVILTGLSGSGKTKLAQAFAMWICEDETQYCLVPVGADWTNREPLLGFANALKSNEYVKPDNKMLDLLISASDNQNKPYFLILDEMNMSHVERYFADFLSVMESGRKLSLHNGFEYWNDVPAEIELPNNLFIIGTVNIDETTYMFSPKVLDRANVIEFRVTADEMKNYLNKNAILELNKLKSAGADMSESFVKIAKDKTLRANNSDILETELLSFFNELKRTGAEFGYRSASEIFRFAAVINTIEPAWSMPEIIDAAVMQKLLPKVHGSRRKLEPVLKTLGNLCLQPGENFDDFVASKSEINFNGTERIKYPLSLEKILRMYQSLIDNGFTSYAEA